MRVSWKYFQYHQSEVIFTKIVFFGKYQFFVVRSVEKYDLLNFESKNSPFAISQKIDDYLLFIAGFQETLAWNAAY